MGKRTAMSEFVVQNRGGKGVKCYKITEKTGNVVGAKAVNEENEIMMITTEGIIIRLQCADISVLGRITSGVKMINLTEGVTVASIAKVRDKIRKQIQLPKKLTEKPAITKKALQRKLSQAAKRNKSRISHDDDKEKTQKKISKEAEIL